jgi:hypothetical protein
MLVSIPAAVRFIVEVPRSIVVVQSQEVALFEAGARMSLTAAAVAAGNQ